MSSLPASIKKIGSKVTEKRWRHHFPHCKSMRAFCYHGHQSFDPVCLKTLCGPSPPPVTATHKIWSRLPNWPQRNIFKFESVKFSSFKSKLTPKWVVRSGPKSNSSELSCLSWLPATLMMILSKMNELAWRHHFPHYKSMGAFCCPGNQSFDPICPKTLCSFSPTPVMLHIKFDQDLPTGFRDIQVWKCGRWRRTIGIL